MDGLKCMNCMIEVGPNEGDLFAAVFVCPRCHAVATRLYERGQQDVRRVLTMMHEAIRVGLLHGQLTFADVDAVDRVHKQDLLVELSRLANEANRCQRTSSSTSTNSGAQIAGGLDGSTSTSRAGSG
jgi:hypothetical protein